MARTGGRMTDWTTTQYQATMDSAKARDYSMSETYKLKSLITAKFFVTPITF